MTETVNLQTRAADEPSGESANRAARSASPLAMDGNGREPMKSPVVKRSIVIAGHKTSVSLEDAFWKGLKDIARGRSMTLSELVASIDTERHHGNLSSGIRLFVLNYYRALSEDLRNKPSRAGDMMSRSAAPSVVAAGR
jgi:predicted DNA-binding ribbon-helix-helix protein